MTLTPEEREALEVFDAGYYSCACPGDYCLSSPCDNQREDIFTVAARIKADALRSTEPTP